MVGLDGVAEQELEPVGVAVLGGAQIGGAGLVSVGQAELAGRLVISVDQLVHLAVDTAVGGVGDLGVVEVTLLIEFLVDVHLVLGVHDVERVVGGDQTGGVLAGVVDVVLAGTTLLGRDDDNAGHGARTVDGGGGAVLQDVETLDIVGVESRDGGGDKGRGVSGGEIIGTDVEHVSHDDAVHHPEGLGAAVDGGGTTDADLGGGAEGTRDILHGHTGDAAFQGAADVGHTIQLRIFGADLGGRTGEEAAVHLLHTGHDDLFQHLGVGLQTDRHLRCDRNFLVDITHEGDHQDLGGSRDIQGKLSVEVGYRTDGLATFHEDRGADHRQSVFFGNDCTLNGRLGIAQGRCEAQTQRCEKKSSFFHRR